MAESARRRQPRDPTRPRGSRLPLVAVGLGLAGLVLGGAAFALVLLRPAGASACRDAAWASLPQQAALPSGWTLSASGVYVDSIGTTMTGPQASASDQSAPAIFVSVGCYGADAAAGMTRSHDVARAGGAEDIAIPAMGDESFGTHDTGSDQYTVYVRRGDLVATLAAAGDVALGDLTAAAKAVDTAMKQGIANPAAVSFVPGSPAASAAESGSPGPSGSDSASVHAAPSLEALVPKKVGTTSLDVTSFRMSDVLTDDDASKALTAELKALGHTPDQLLVAEGYDTAQAQTWYVDAFQLPGVSGTKLATAIGRGWLQDAAKGTTSTTVALDSKRVVHVDRGQDPGDWIYVHNDVVYDVGTSDQSVVRSVLAGLP